MRNCLVIDLNRCTGCDSCVAACKHENGIGLGVYRNSVKRVGPSGTWPYIEQYWLPVQCQQCENAACVEVCPTGAAYRDEATGLVLQDKDACIGCQLCMPACPFGVRWYDEDNGIIEKCTCCIQRLEKGQKPACVAICCTGARLYGDLDDPESDVAKAVAAAAPEDLHQLEDPTGAAPRTIYILSANIASWK